MPGGFSRFSKERTFRLGPATGYLTNDSNELLNHLLALPADVIVQAQEYALTEEVKKKTIPAP